MSDHHHRGHNGHSHGHGHSPAVNDFGWAFAVGTALNIGIVVLQAVYGILANSVALIADAGHNLGDVFGLLLAWGASELVKRPPSPRFTYGMGASSILAAIANGVFLLVATGAIAWEAIQRLSTPESVAGKTVMIVAAIGILANGFTAWLFMSGRETDINIRGAFLHMASDAAISFGVVIAGLVILSTGWLWLDPVVSLVIAALIVWGTWGLLRDSVLMALAAVPDRIEPQKVRQSLETLHGVEKIHDLHIWPMSTTETALTCHLVMPGGHPGDQFVRDAADMLRHRFKIVHTTSQIEVSGNNGCALEPDDVI